MLQLVAGAWPGLAEARGRSIFNTSVFLWRASANQGRRGKTKKSFLCVILCDTKMDV